MKAFYKPSTIVLTGTLFIATSVYIYFLLTVASEQLRIFRLTQLFGLLSLGYLYVTLLISPLYICFPRLVGRSFMFEARKYFGISACAFGVLHASVAFFGQLGGFAGLFFLNNNYLTALAYSTFALIVLVVLTLLSIPVFERIAKPLRKPISKLLYVAGMAVIVHALMLGTHFTELSAIIPQVVFCLVFILLILEAYRIELFTQKTLSIFPRYMLLTIMVISLSGLFSYLLLNSQSSASTISVHSQHIPSDTASPSLTHVMQVGNFEDYEIRLLTQDVLPAAEDVTIEFEVINRRTKQPVALFSQFFEKVMHLIIVDSSLTYYSHIHPELNGTTFSVSTRLPADGEYYLYFDYQPVGTGEIQSSSRIVVGNKDMPGVSDQAVDTPTRKTFGMYDVELNTYGSLQAPALTRGQQKLGFTVRNAQTKSLITDLQPYLGAFGHLVMIHQRDYDYIHVHPLLMTNTITPGYGGPLVEFSPMSVNKPIKPGVYRAFAQFMHNDVLFTADFTIEVE